MILTYKTISAPIIFLLFFATAFDPQGGMYGIKDIALLSAGFLCLIYVVFNKQIKINNIQLFFLIWFTLFLPAYGILNAIIRGVSFANFIDTSYIMASIIFLLTFLYNEKNLNLSLNIFIKVVRVLSMIIIMALVFSLFFSSGNFVWFFVEHEAAFFGMRNIGPIPAYYIFFVASPLLLYLYFYDLLNLVRQKNIRSLIYYFSTILALVLTGNKMNLLIVLISLGLLPLISLKNFYTKIAMFFLIVLSLLFIIALNLSSIEIILQSLFGGDARLSYFANYRDILNTNFDLIFGQGFEAYVWSNDFLALVNPDHATGHASKVELTYLEFLRVFGIANLFIFLIFIIYLLKKLYFVRNTDQWIFYGFLFYLIGCFSNPNLFSIVGMVPLGLIFGYVRLENQVNTNNAV